VHNQKGFRCCGALLARIVCALAGHDDKRLPVPDHCVGGAFAPRRCLRCGRETPAFEWPRIPMPAGAGLPREEPACTLATMNADYWARFGDA
jgi:hypothetical protein